MDPQCSICRCYAPRDGSVCDDCGEGPLCDRPVCRTLHGTTCSRVLVPIRKRLRGEAT